MSVTSAIRRARLGRRRKLRGQTKEEVGMTLHEVIRQASMQARLTQLKAQELFWQIVRSIRDGLETDGVVNLSAFGTFRVEDGGPSGRRGRPANGFLNLPDGKVVTFRPGAYLKTRPQQQADDSTADDSGERSGFTPDGGVTVVGPQMPEQSTELGTRKP